MRLLHIGLHFRRYFQNCSIRQKLMIIIMGVSTLTLVLISAVFMVNDAQTIRGGMVQDLSAVGKIIGDRSKASLTFDDARVATENLASLAAKSSIVAACIYDAEDNVFASYYRDISGIPCPSVKSPQYYFDDASLHVYQPILQAQDKLGTIYIRADLNEINQSLNQYILYAAGFVLLTLLVAYILSAKLQAVVSEPLTRLARTVRAVSTEADYSIRAEKISDDELGTLVDAFNAMLEQIHDRDSALVKSKEAAETASKAKSHFLANINHELRTPLNAIIGFSEIIKNEMLGKLENPKYSSYAKDIYTAGTHLLQLINDILDYSKLESGQIDLSLDTVDLNRTLKTVVRLTLPQATEHSIEILREVTEDPLTIVTDERKLRQVLLNVLSNAVKFNPDRGKVTVRAWRDRGRSAVIIEVVDTGIGIAAEDMDTAMAPFGQVESGLNRHYEGTGLGLPLSKKYVQAMGGVFELQSTPGLGTTVTITLPLQPIKGS